MFFHYTNFTDYLTEDQAKLTAKRANEVIDKNGHLVFGNINQDNQCMDFSTEKTRTHTHVGILIGAEVMGSLKPSDSPMKLDRTTSDDMDRALRDKLKYLERENKNLLDKMQNRQVPR